MQEQTLFEIETDSQAQQPAVLVNKAMKTKKEKVRNPREKMYSEADITQFSKILAEFHKKQTDKTMTRHQLLTQHKDVLIQIFESGASVKEVLEFLKEKNFVGITAEILKEFIRSNQ